MRLRRYIFTRKRPSHQSCVVVDLSELSVEELAERQKRHSELFERVRSLAEHSHRDLLLSFLKTERPAPRYAGVASGGELHALLVRKVLEDARALQTPRGAPGRSVAPVGPAAGSVGLKASLAMHRKLLDFVMDNKLREVERS